MNAYGRTIDKTYLSLDTAEERGFVHRDYIAHVLRWTHVLKRLLEHKAYASARILDVGAGRELPMGKALYSNRTIPLEYIGVDAGSFKEGAVAMLTKTGSFPATLLPSRDICDVPVEELRGPCNWLTCLEMFEHVEPEHLVRILRHLPTLLSEDAILLVSTPCWDGRTAAGNHVNEISHGALGALLEREGYAVTGVYGTFASIRDYRHLLPDPWAQLFDQLRSYYDTHLLSCIFAPLFPAQARNCLWELRLARSHGPSNKFPKLEDVPGPWGSSDKWEQLFQDLD